MKQNEYYKTSKLSNEKKDIKWKKYNDIWDIYYEACLTMKMYIKKLLNFYKPLKIKVVGCSVFGKKHYEYCI